MCKSSNRCSREVKKDTSISVGQRTLNSVGTISLGVLSPINISRPTNVMIDMKIAKSLMSFRSCTFTEEKRKIKMEKTKPREDQRLNKRKGWQIWEYSSNMFDAFKSFWEFVMSFSRHKYIMIYFQMKILNWIFKCNNYTCMASCSYFNYYT